MDSQDSRRGVTVQRKCDSAVALPMLLNKVNDTELMVWCDRGDGMAA
ncbi:hypothetical protein QUB08_05565 [Microcoleus sp. BR0-C5]